MAEENLFMVKQYYDSNSVEVTCDLFPLNDPER